MGLSHEQLLQFLASLEKEVKAEEAKTPNPDGWLVQARARLGLMRWLIKQSEKQP